MLSDRGLATQKDRDALTQRASDMLNGKAIGCNSSSICEKCNHLISDSVCLCIPVFVCPNCGFQNGQAIIKMNEEARKLPTLSQPTPTARNKTLRMIDDLITLETNRDKQWKQVMTQLHRGQETLGESAMLHHLRDLKKLVEIEFRDCLYYTPSNIPDDAV